MKNKLEWKQVKKGGNYMALGLANIYIYRQDKIGFILIIGNQLSTTNVCFNLKTEKACRLIAHNLEFE